MLGLGPYVLNPECGVVASTPGQKPQVANHEPGDVLVYARRWPVHTRPTRDSWRRGGNRAQGANNRWKTGTSQAPASAANARSAQGVCY